jgi:hypothetical protein
MANKIIFWDENNSTVDDPISKGAGFGIFQEFCESMNALQTFSTPIIIHKNSKIVRDADASHRRHLCHMIRVSKEA